MAEKERVVLKIELSREEYEALKARARGEGYLLPSEYARELLRRALAKGEERAGEVNVKEIAEGISKRVERSITDLLNPFTGKIDEISRKISELIELMEAERERAKEVREPAKEVKERRPLSAMERLKEQRAVFSEDMKWMKAPDKFFEKLKREGAHVIEVGEEKIAVHPEFWERFKEEVGSISVKSVDEASDLIGSYLGEEGAKLFKKLARSGLLVYDEDSGQWILSSKL
ncbi:MAG: hypothetical protein N3F67_00825 [Acidilobaceae archaeon]|nr:hypothetical protein [Acidilobaceae archaeon]